MKTEKIKPAKDKPTPVMVEIDVSAAKDDAIGQLAKACYEAQTPHRESQGACEATLALPAEAKAGDQEKIQEALAKVKGVKAKEAKVAKGEIHIPLDEKGGAKLSEIREALTNAGVKLKEAKKGQAKD